MNGVKFLPTESRKYVNENSYTINSDALNTCLWRYNTLNSCITLFEKSVHSLTSPNAIKLICTSLSAGSVSCSVWHKVRHSAAGTDCRSGVQAGATSSCSQSLSGVHMYRHCILTFSLGKSQQGGILIGDRKSF